MLAPSYVARSGPKLLQCSTDVYIPRTGDRIDGAGNRWAVKVAIVLGGAFAEIAVVDDIDVGRFGKKAVLEQPQLADITADLLGRETKAVAIGALGAEQAERLVEEYWVIDRDWKLDVTRMARTECLA